MKQVYLLEEDENVKRVEHEVYEELFNLLKLKKPNAEALIEDPELFALCDPLVVFRLGQIKVRHVMEETPNFYLVEVEEGQA